MRKGVEVIRSPQKARVLVDPMRREVLRLLSEQPMTENGLAETLGLSDPSVGHHLKILTGSGLIRIARKEIEKHGILQKFYEANALVYFFDDREMPLEIKRYFMPVSLERARGMIAALGALTSEPKRLLAGEVEQFAKTLNSEIVKIARRYPKRWKGHREEVINRIYRGALAHLLEKTDLLPESARRVLAQTRRRP